MESAPIRVLMVEDDPLDQMAFKRLVMTTHFNYDCTIVDSVADARQALTSHTFDVVLVDYLLPDGTGFDVFEATKGTPLIFVTGTGDQEIAVNAMKIGAYDYLIKDTERRYLKVLPIRLENAIRQKRAEDVLRLIEFERSVAGVFRVSLDGRLIECNETFARILGYDTRADALAAPRILLDFDAADHRAFLTALQQQPFVANYELRLKRCDGGRVYVLTNAGYLAAPDRDITAVIEGTLVDITERKQAEEALRESEARLRAIVDTAVDAIITIDEKGCIESFNAAAERIFGYQADEVVGQNVNILMPPPYHQEHDGYLQRYLETGTKKIIGIGREVVGLRKDGSTFPMDLSVSEVHLSGRRLFTGLIRDITRRRQLENEILRISDEERRRIGQDLHDGLGQMLTGIGLISLNLAKKMKAVGTAEAEEVVEITNLIKEADLHARSLARGLVPVDVEANGLAPALRRLATNAERLFGITCTFEEAASSPIPDINVSTHLYRIAQEAVSNAVKHGRADRVAIHLAAGHERIRLRVHDDGVGFPETLPEDRGMGVRVMHHRARIIGAKLNIERGSSTGTVITCTLNLSGQ